MLRTSTKIVIITIVLQFLVSFQLFSQNVRVERRVMSDQEFTRLKEFVGVYEEGRNYNKIIGGHGTGLKPPTASQWERMRYQPILADDMEFAPGDAPSSVDNSATIWFPPIGDQSVEGSCVAWATGYYTKTFQEAREHNWDLSGCVWEDGHPSEPYQDMIFSPDFIYHQINDGEDQGAYYSDALNLLERIGCCSWEKMPYDPYDHTTWPDEPAWREAPWYRSETGYAYMWVETDEALDDLKQWLANGDVAIISINADLYYRLTAEDLWTTDNYNGIATNHANTIVGYDDDYGPYEEAGNPNTYGAFKVANSWGVGGSWEHVADGFYYISYECMKQEVRLFYFYENKLNYEPEMIAVFQMTHARRGDCETTVGIGQTSDPDTTKRFDDYDADGGAQPFPANKMVLDITEFQPYMSGSEDNFFLKVYDDGSEAGTIDFFSIEIYDDYASGVPKETYISDDTPVDIVASANAYAQVTTGTEERYDISGTVSYDGTGRPVSDADLDLTHDEGSSSETSDANGQYLFASIVAGAAELVPSKEGDLREAITGSDALLVLQYLAFLATLNDDQQFAADVTEDGSVTGSDAQAILRYLAFFSDNIASTGQWRFIPSDTSFTLSADAIVDFKAYLKGDANLDWGAGTEMLNASLPAVSDAGLVLNLDQAEIADSNIVEIPLLLSTSGKINTLIFTLEYNAAGLSFESVEQTNLSQDFLMAANGNDPGKVHIAMAGVAGIENSGVVLRFKFRINNNSGLESPGDFMFSRTIVNDQRVTGLVSGNATLTGVKKTALPGNFNLSQNYPNPFNPETMIKFQLPHQAVVQLKIYNTMGQLIRTLVDGEMKAGFHQITWDGKDSGGEVVSSGVYLYSLEAGGFKMIRKMAKIQ